MSTSRESSISTCVQTGLASDFYARKTLKSLAHSSGGIKLQRWKHWLDAAFTHCGPVEADQAGTEEKNCAKHYVWDMAEKR